MKQKSRRFYPQYSPLIKKEKSPSPPYYVITCSWDCSPKHLYAAILFLFSKDEIHVSLFQTLLSQRLLSQGIAAKEDTAEASPKTFLSKVTATFFFLINIIKDTITIRLSWKQARILVQNTVTSQVMPGSSPLRSHCKHNPL